jgi:hypothetical protein
MPLFRKKPKDNKPASELLESAVEGHEEDIVSLGELMLKLHERGFALLLMVLVLPNCVPIPVPPGTSTVFSIPLLFLTCQMLLNYDHPWLPIWLANKGLKRSFLQALVAKIGPRMKRVEKLLKARIPFFETRNGELLIGFMWLLFAISIAIPLPMTNFLPGVGILVSALGMLSRDGYMIIAGFAIGVVGLIVTSIVVGALMLFGWAAMESAVQWLGSLI